LDEEHLMATNEKIFKSKERLDWSKISGVAVVRNEADIIGLNLEHLVSYGIKSFVIVDDNSDDGTVECINKFRNENTEIKLVLIRAEEIFLQKESVVNFAAALAQRKFGTDWIFPVSYTHLRAHET